MFDPSPDSSLDLISDRYVYSHLQVGGDSIDDKGMAIATFCCCSCGTGCNLEFYCSVVWGYCMHGY